MSADVSLDALCREHLPLLRAIAICRFEISRNDAEGLVNDLFVSFLERQPRVANVRAYLTGAMRNLCLLYWRSRGAEVPLEAEHDEIASPEAEEEWARRLALATALARIGPCCREMLRAYYLRGESPTQIAEAFGGTPEHVMNRVVSCRRAVYEILPHGNAG